MSRAPLVVLGASNTVLGFGALLRAARRAIGEPLDVYGAIGHGRSYGVASRVLGRTLAGIVECGIWDALDAAAAKTAGGAAPLHALLADAGNDVAYGFDPPDIAGWMDRCVERLQGVDARARIVITGLPLASLAGLSRVRFLVMRTILYPGRFFGLEETLARAAELEARLRDLAARRGAAFESPDPAWYGLDPVHIRRRCREEAWPALLSSWSRAAAAGSSGLPADFARLSARGLAPERRRILGIELRRAQPCAQLEDGSMISLY